VTESSSSRAIVSHRLTVERRDGERVHATVMVAPSDSAALIYGDHDAVELTLCVQVRCPANFDVLGLDNCDCAARYARGMDAVLDATLGMFVYLNAGDDLERTYLDLGTFVGELPNVRRVQLLNYTVAEACILRDVGYEVTHFATRDASVSPVPSLPTSLLSRLRRRFR